MPVQTSISFGLMDEIAVSESFSLNSAPSWTMYLELDGMTWYVNYSSYFFQPLMAPTCQVFAMSYAVLSAVIFQVIIHTVHGIYLYALCRLYYYLNIMWSLHS